MKKTNWKKDAAEAQRMKALMLLITVIIIIIASISSRKDFDLYQVLGGSGIAIVIAGIFSFIWKGRKR